MTSEAILSRTSKTRVRPDVVFWAAALVLTGLVVLAIIAPILPMRSYSAMSAARLASPGPAYWFGTDQFGRDLMVRVLFGLRTSLWIGGLGVAASTVLGTAIGLIAGYTGGWLDTVLMRTLDALLAFPSLLLAIGVAAILGPGAVSTALALGIVGVPQMARIVRAGTLSETHTQYVEAARSVGTGTGSILLRHILPNVLHLISVQMVMFFVVAVLTEASLSFLGLGIQVPVPSLGSMLKEARDYIGSAPWFVIAPGAALTLSVLALNVFADGLRTRLGS